MKTPFLAVGKDGKLLLPLGQQPGKTLFGQIAFFLLARQGEKTLFRQLFLTEKGSNGLPPGIPALIYLFSGDKITAPMVIRRVRRKGNSLFVF